MVGVILGELDQSTKNEELMDHMQMYPYLSSK